MDYTNPIGVNMGYDNPATNYAWYLPPVTDRIRARTHNQTHM